MTRRVMEELRIAHPYDDDELLRVTATKTALGAAVAFRLSCEDVARAMRPLAEEWRRRLRSLRAPYARDGDSADSVPDLHEIAGAAPDPPPAPPLETV